VWKAPQGIPEDKDNFALQLDEYAMHSVSQASVSSKRRKAEPKSNEAQLDFRNTECLSP
jgi:hypothetical protein